MNNQRREGGREGPHEEQSRQGSRARTQKPGLGAPKEGTLTSGMAGGEKKLKKDSHCSVLVMGLAFLAPFLGFLRSTIE